MRYSVPPDETARIYPSVKRQLVFAAGGLLAILVRITTAHDRAALARKRENASLFLYEPYGMGDVIVLQPLILSFLDSGRNVILAAKPAWFEIVPPHPNFTFVPVSPAYTAYEASKKYRGFFRSALNLAQSLREYASGTEGIDVRGDVRSLIILYLAGCGRVRTLPRYFTANDCLVMPFAAERVQLLHGVSRRIVNAAFAPPGTYLKRPSLTHLMPAAAVIPDYRRIGLIPLTPWIGKRWIPELWRETILRLRVEGFAPVVLCGPDETDDALAAVGGEDLSLECREATGVRNWVALLAKCGSVITVNTGPMHIADALNKPLVVIEGSSRLPLWAPEGEHAFVVHHQDVAGCAPCHQVGDVKKCHRRCMALTRPDEVMVALQEVLRKES